MTAALTLKLFTKQLVDIDAPITELTEELARQSELVSAGNLKRCEAMLVTQAQTLDAIFNSLAVRSGRNMSEYQLLLRSTIVRVTYGVPKAEKRMRQQKATP